MGRVRVQLRKIENKTYRHITFAKRKSGIVKKAYELSTLCDVEVALILFSPAGKLFLFDGMKRVEETLCHYIDLPARRRGRVQNRELIRRMITEMCLEAGFASTIVGIPNNVEIDSKLQQIQRELLIYRTQLDDVEKQLQYFLRNFTCDKSMSEVRYHEMVLEETLKLVQFRKRILEAKYGIQQTPKEFGDTIGPHLIREASAEQRSVSRSLDYNLSWQYSKKDLLVPRNFPQSDGLIQLSRNFPEPSVDAITYLQEHQYFFAENEGFMHQSASGLDKANCPPRTAIIHQEKCRGNKAAGRKVKRGVQ